MKLLFLDIDGVLNKCMVVKITIDGLTHEEVLEPKMINNLNKIVSETDCDIVISSSWRIPYSLDKLRQILSLNGFQYSEKIIDTTPRIKTGKMSKFVSRGHEIDKWIRDNNFNGVFVILDDNSDMEHLKGNLIQTNTFEGLTSDITNRLIRKFNKTK